MSRITLDKHTLIAMSVIIALMLVAELMIPVVHSASKTEIKGVVYEFDVIKFAKISAKTHAVEFNLIISFKIANYSSTDLYIPLGIPFLLKKKYHKAVNPILRECIVLYRNANIVKSASLIVKGLSRVYIRLKEPIVGRNWAFVKVVVQGMIKSKSQLYVTGDYKFYKDFKPISGKILFVRIINYFYNVDWEPDKLDGVKVPGLRVRVVAPNGWSIFYARSSLTRKLRYTDIHYIGEENGRYVVEFWYLSSKTIKPTTFKAGSEFDIEVGFMPVSDFRNPVALGFGILLIALAAFFSWYYRDVWKYVTRKVSIVTQQERRG